MQGEKWESRLGHMDDRRQTALCHARLCVALNGVQQGTCFMFNLSVVRYNLRDTFQDGHELPGDK